MAGNINTVSTFSDYGADQKAIDRRRKLAEALQAQSQTESPAGQMVGNVFVKTSPLHGLAKALSAGLSAYQQKGLDAEEKSLASRRRQELAQWVGGMPQERTETTQTPFDMASVGQDMEGQEPIPGLANEQTTTTKPTKQQLLAWALQGATSGDPSAAAIAGPIMKDAMTPQRPVVVGRSLLDPNTGKTVGVDQTWQAEQQATREQRMQELQMRLQDQRLTAQDRANLQRELQQMQIQARQDMQQFAVANRQPSQPRPPVAVEDTNNPGQSIYVTPDQAVGRRPMKATDNSGRLPASALKLQQEELDAIGTASSITTDLAALSKQLDEGKLKLGPVANVANTVRNFAGFSSEESKNLVSFKATLEKLRNDSLRLNKGVQTEGDSQRAWNELLTNINDPGVVKQRLGEIQAINQRAATLRRANVDVIRQNFGAGPLDTSTQTSQPPAVGAAPASPSAPARPERRQPKAGDVVDGYRFKGGNPADRNAWEKQ